MHLTPKAFELLHVLMEEHPRAVSKKQLQDRLWPDVVVQEANLKNLIAEIRAALGDDGASVIRTVQRFGYAMSLGDSAEATTAARLIAGPRTHPLKPGENVIGRDADCSVVIDFTGVSRRHATIRVAEQQTTLEDLGSKNGTFRNGERLYESVQLEDGDRIRLGAMTLIFRSAQRAKETTTHDG